MSDEDGEEDKNFTQYKSSWDYRESFLIDTGNRIFQSKSSNIQNFFIL